MRYYPASLPGFPDEPTPDRFRISQITDTSGQGIIALKDFEVGDLVFAFTGFLVTEQTQFSLQIKPGLYLHDPFFMGKALHSCDPNCHVDMERRQFTALKTIRAGDLVTMDYEQTEDELFKGFACECGASACRQVILGRAVPRNVVGPQHGLPLF